MQLTDKITLATPEQRQQTDTLYNAACKVVSSLAIDDTQQLNTLAITRRVDHYAITWQRYNTAYHAAFVTAIATSHEGYTRQEWRDDTLVVYHSLDIAGWQSVTSNTKLEERVERKSKRGKKRY
jgi:hypothetical protein